jgi:hypothetical protein
VNGDVLTIVCPHCRGQHIYSLEVSRSYYVGHLTHATPASDTIRFTRLFHCPIEDRDFQATFSMSQHFGTIINDVTVKGVSSALQEDETPDPDS